MLDDRRRRLPGMREIWVVDLVDLRPTIRPDPDLSPMSTASGWPASAPDLPEPLSHARHPWLPKHDL